MSDPTPSIRERIERQQILDLITVTEFDAANVQRLGKDGNNPVIIDGVRPNGWAVITYGEEDVIGADDQWAIMGAETMMLPFNYDLHLPAIPEGWTYAEHANYWRAKLRLAVRLEDPDASPTPILRPNCRETATGTLLAVDTIINGTYGPTVEKDQTDPIVGMHGYTVYRHAEGDPYTLI